MSKGKLTGAPEQGPSRRELHGRHRPTVVPADGLPLVIARRYLRRHDDVGLPVFLNFGKIGRRAQLVLLLRQRKTGRQTRVELRFGVSRRGSRCR